MPKKSEARKAGQPAEEVRYWLGEIASAKRREKDYRKDGDEVIEIYCGKKPDQISFNILFSQTETLLPALFSQVPRPVVQRRFKDDDPLGAASSKAGQRMLEYLCDTNVEGYETFEQSVRYATLDGLLPGRGITSIKYDADILDTGEEGSVPVVNWEQVCTETRGWDRVYFGYAKKWSKVPWLAYEEFIDKEEAERLFGADIAGKITYTLGEDDDDPEEKGTGTGGRDDADNEQGGRKTALVYQIWDKSGGKVVRYISPAYHDGYLKVEDDPLGITGFYNCPRPLQFIEKSNDLLPTAMYKLYENQAKELNNLTRRLQKVVSALKVRGAYDGSLGNEIESILKEDDNALIPTDKASSLIGEGGLDKAIWFMPLQELMQVAEKLVAAREQCKRVIYEITGVSDIIRGQSVASETLGAQKIKESWGTMRLKRLQKEVQRYSRDMLRIMLEIAASKFSVETWAKATGLPFVTAQQKQQVQQIVQAQQMQAQQQAMMAQQQGMQPPPPQPPDPQIQQALAAPVWDDVLALLRDDIQRAYRIDIETNSTVDVEATEDQQQIGDFMNAMGQLLAGLNPMVESGTMPFEGAKELMLAVIRRFRFGTEVEEQFKNMQAPPPKGNPEADKAKAEMAQSQQDAKMKMAEMQQKAQMEQQSMQAEMQQNMAEFKAEMQQKVMEFNAEMQLERMKLQSEKEAEIAKLQADMQVEAAKLQGQQRIEQMKANTQRDTEIKKAQLAAATQIRCAKIAANSAEGGEENEVMEMISENRNPSRNEAMMQKLHDAVVALSGMHDEIMEQQEAMQTVAIKPIRDNAGRLAGAIQIKKDGTQISIPIN